MGLSHSNNTFKKQAIVIDTINGVFNNPTADAINKRVTPATEADLIGYHIDLTHQTIRPCDRAIETLLFHFTFRDPNDIYFKKGI
jgi:hypothetical protein